MFEPVLLLILCLTVSSQFADANLLSLGSISFQLYIACYTHITYGYSLASYNCNLDSNHGKR